MATTTGTSAVGFQDLVSFKVLTVAQMDVRFTSTPNGIPLRLGYFYVSAIQNVTPFQEFVLSRGILYSPGTYMLFPANFGFTTFRYNLRVNWNKSGFVWTATFG